MLQKIPDKKEGAEIAPIMRATSLAIGIRIMLGRITIAFTVVGKQNDISKTNKKFAIIVSSYYELFQWGIGRIGISSK